MGNVSTTADWISAISAFAVALFSILQFFIIRNLSSAQKELLEAELQEKLPDINSVDIYTLANIDRKTFSKPNLLGFTISTTPSAGVLLQNVILLDKQALEMGAVIISSVTNLSHNECIVMNQPIDFDKGGFSMPLNSKGIFVIEYEEKNYHGDLPEIKFEFSFKTKKPNPKEYKTIVSLAKFFSPSGF